MEHDQLNTPHDADMHPDLNVPEEEAGSIENSDIGSKVATIAVVGVGVALISAELLPGMLIGVAAAFLPGIGKHMRPLMKNTVKAGYAAMKKTREMVAEASEQVQDMIAEAKAEDVPPVPVPEAANAAAPKH